MGIRKGTKLDLGPWATSEIDFEETARQVAGLGADAELPDEVRFLAGVVRLVLKRMATDTLNEDPLMPAIFLLNPCSESEIDGNIPKHKPLLDNGLTPVAGRLWFVSPAVVEGTYVDFDCDDDVFFELVNDGLRLGNVPAVIFDPRTTNLEIRYYRDGLSKAEDCDMINLKNTEISMEQVFSLINLVHRNTLVSPDGQPQEGKLWRRNSRHWPAENAEGMIQLYLVVGLKTKFPWCTPRFEQPGISGRLDIQIEVVSPLNRLNVIQLAILELKVLRSFGSTGKSVSKNETLEWVKEGVKQAASYRDDRHAQWAALCCFDMRKEDTGESCFEHVLELAERLDVILKIWFLFASAKEYRDGTTVKI